MQQTRKEDIIRNLKGNRQEVVNFFGELGETQLEIQVYDHGAEWNVGQVLAHLITIEYSMQKLFENLLEGGDGAPADFDLERYNRSQPKKLDHLSREELIERFSKIRAKTIAMVNNMTETDLDRTGRHPYHGQGTLERFVRWAYEHAEHHIEVIEETLE